MQPRTFDPTCGSHRDTVGTDVGLRRIPMFSNKSRPDPTSHLSDSFRSDSEPETVGSGTHRFRSNLNNPIIPDTTRSAIRHSPVQESSRRILSDARLHLSAIIPIESKNNPHRHCTLSENGFSILKSTIGGMRLG